MASNMARFCDKSCVTGAEFQIYFAAPQKSTAI